MIHTPHLQILDHSRNKQLPWEGWKPPQSSTQGSLHRSPSPVNSTAQSSHFGTLGRVSVVASAGNYVRVEPAAKGGIGYNGRVAEQVIHISEAGATSDFAALLARVRAGAEVIIEHESQPVVVMHSMPPARRLISECIALLPEDSTATVDPDFAQDVEAAIEGHREPLASPPWD
jgi:antitoxin (DNA-binding transcriptional repressor) of toxin-antitoxin stability system